MSSTKTAEPLRCRLGADLGEPREPCVRWGPYPPREGAIFGVVWPIEKHWQPLQQCMKNGWTDRDAIWGADSCELKEALIRWAKVTAMGWQGNFWHMGELCKNGWTYWDDIWEL